MEEELPLSSFFSFSYLSALSAVPPFGKCTKSGDVSTKSGKVCTKSGEVCTKSGDVSKYKKNGDCTLTELQAIRKLCFEYSFLPALAKTCLRVVLKDSDISALSVLKYFSAKLDFPFKGLCVTYVYLGHRMRTR